MKVIVDIDGTIAKVGDRLKYLQQEKKDWDAFYEHCDEDEPIDDMCQLVADLFVLGHEIVFCTGRRESVRQKTLSWLRQNVIEVFDNELLMRKDGDYRPDTEVKPELLANAGIGPEDVYFVLEDRDSVVAKLRSLGFRVLQVNEGKF
jgi:phosphoglycolate phosphatase-like HAD superfamily hydrolase